VRVLALAALGRLKDAFEELPHTLSQGHAPTRAYFLRAQYHQRLGDKVAAAKDVAQGMRPTPTDADSWLARAEARLPADPRAALSDVEQALRLNPRSLNGLQDKASIQAENLGRTDEAVHVLGQSIDCYPEYVPARSSRGVLLARLGKRGPALEDTRETLIRDTSPPVLYHLAGIYALTSKESPEDCREAYRLLASAFNAGYGLGLVDEDQDLDPIRGYGEFQRLLNSARALQGQK
jgi:tetratricopeptide (TPR) repeat protein